MQLKTILNRVTDYKSFVVEKVKWAVDRGVISATFAANLGRVSGCELEQIG